MILAVHDNLPSVDVVVPRETETELGRDYDKL